MGRCHGGRHRKRGARYSSSTRSTGSCTGTTAHFTTCRTRGSPRDSGLFWRVVHGGATAGRSTRNGCSSWRFCAANRENELGRITPHGYRLWRVFRAWRVPGKVLGLPLMSSYNLASIINQPPIATHSTLGILLQSHSSPAPMHSNLKLNKCASFIDTCSCTAAPCIARGTVTGLVSSRSVV